MANRTPTMTVYSDFETANRRARLVFRSRPSRGLAGFTFTKYRDDGSLKVSARTTVDNSTEVVITRGGNEERLVLNGREARTLQRALNKHYAELSEVGSEYTYE